MFVVKVRLDDRVLFAARSNELILRGCLRDDEFRRHSESEPE